MEGRISATGLKSVELDELTTNQIIINNEGLQKKLRVGAGRRAIAGVGVKMSGNNFFEHSVVRETIKMYGKPYNI